MNGFKEWGRNNPLYAWREQTGTGRGNVAVKAGVSYNIVARWEAGHVAPNAENMTTLAAIMGADVNALRSAWVAWLADGQKIKL